MEMSKDTITASIPVLVKMVQISIIPSVKGIIGSIGVPCMPVATELDNNFYH